MNDLILDGHKLLWHRNRVEALLAGERVAPITVDCAITRKCNYNCVYCYRTLQENTERKMTRDIIYRFLDDAAEIGVKAISFVSDGESTCSPHVYDAILRGKSNGLDMALGTNGYLLKDERLEDILPALTYLRFNVSAADPQRYSYVMGCAEKCYEKVMNTIRECVRIKKKNNLNVTIGLQMVLMPELTDQILPMAKLGKELGVDYTVIKHCSDDEFHTLGIDYSKYFDLVPLLKQAEAMTTPNYLVKAKWSKILSGGIRDYSRCYAPPLIAQFSGSGLVAPCGMMFHNRYKKRFHIGNLAETSFKQLWQSERYWKVMDYLASGQFDPKTQCGSLCLQHLLNIFLNDIKEGKVVLAEPQGEPPEHINFI